MWIERIRKPVLLKTFNFRTNPFECYNGNEIKKRAGMEQGLNEIKKNKKILIYSTVPRD